MSPKKILYYEFSISCIYFRYEINIQMPCNKIKIIIKSIYTIKGIVYIIRILNKNDYKSKIFIVGGMNYFHMLFFLLKRSAKQL